MNTLIVPISLFLSVSTIGLVFIVIGCSVTGAILLGYGIGSLIFQTCKRKKFKNIFGQSE